MKEPKPNDVAVDSQGTRRMRQRAASAKKIKITINIDHDSLETIRRMAGHSGASYQKLLNQILKEGLQQHESSESRLDRLEKEIARLKKRVA